MRRMTKSLKTLIRLAKGEVEKEQEKLSNLQARWNKFDQQKNELQENLKKEAEFADKQPEQAANFGKFATATKDKVAKLYAEMKKLDPVIEKQRDRLRAAYAEEKKYEITLENKEKQALEVEQKREQKRLDEVAGQRYQREQ